VKTKKLITALAVGSLVTLSACSSSSDDDDNVTPDNTTGDPKTSSVTCPSNTTAIAGSASCKLAGNYTADLTLTKDITWVLSGGIIIGGDNTDSATLTIEPGSKIIGESGADFLVISRGSKIMAQGTAAEPIIMTAANESGRGKWGGLIINGNAPLSGCGAAVGTCEAEGEGSSGKYGGNTPDDNSGVLKYLVVKHAGHIINDKDELNGIAFQAVGSGTTVDFIQVHNNADDGIEFFGGTVNVKHVVLTGNADDSLDWTSGWTGHAQYVLIKQAADAGDHGIEADNNTTLSNDLPRSSPSLANVTIISAGSDDADAGILLRAGTAAQIYNTIVTGPFDHCLNIDNNDTFDNAGTDAATAAASDQLTMTNSIVNCASRFKDDAAEPWLVSDWYNAGTNNSTANPLLSGYIPTSSSPALTSSNLAALPDNGFFELVDFIGAVKNDADDWTKGWTVGLHETSANCPQGTTEMTGTQTICKLQGTYTSDLTLTADKLWVLSGGVFIGGDNADSATLIINAGSKLIGQSGADFLVISRGSKIMANGTKDAPIIMTSVEETGYGKWGGLMINGNAPISGCKTAVGDCVAQGEGGSGEYGGNNPNDDSGVLNYVVVKHAGHLINDTNELNGIAFQGVGDGTTVDFVQVHNNADDGFEFFGGTVNVKHIVLTGNTDDSLDWTSGWTGKAQFVVIKQSAEVGNRAIEADNNKGARDDAPRSKPMLANMTLIGGGSPDGDEGIRLREGTAVNIYNTIITGAFDHCLNIDHDPTFTNGGADAALAAAGSELTIQSSMVNCGASFEDKDSDPWLVSDWFNAGSNNSESDPGLTGVVNGATANAAVATDMSTIDSFFDSVDYIGAVPNEANDWTQGWTVGLN